VEILSKCFSAERATLTGEYGERKNKRVLTFTIGPPSLPAVKRAR
jgi:hypothetical protein